MKSLIAVVLCLFVPVPAFAEAAGYKVAYDGGSVPQKAGTSMYLYIESNQIRLAQKSEVLATIPAASVTEISYGQDVHRRVGTAIGLAVVSLGIGALMLLSKSKKHFVGITWVDGECAGSPSRKYPMPQAHLRVTTAPSAPEGALQGIVLQEQDGLCLRKPPDQAQGRELAGYH